MQTETPFPRKLLQSGMWRRNDVTCLEVFRFQAYEQGLVLDGRILAAVEGSPVEAYYTVFCTTLFSGGQSDPANTGKLESIPVPYAGSRMDE